MDRKIVAKQLQELNRARIDDVNGARSASPDHRERSFFRFIDKNPLFSDNSVNAIYEYNFSVHKSRSGYKIVLEIGINDFTNQFMSPN